MISCGTTSKPANHQIQVEPINKSLKTIKPKFTGNSGSGTFTKPNWSIDNTKLLFGQSTDNKKIPTYSENILTNLKNNNYLWISVKANKGYQFKGTIDPLIIKIVGLPTPPINIIDLSKTINVNQLITKMNDKMNFISPKSAAWIGNPDITTETKVNHYNISKNQYQIMGSTIVKDVPLILKFNGKEETFTSNLHNYTLDVKESIDDMLKNNWNIPGGKAAMKRYTDRYLAMAEGTATTYPNITAYMGNLAQQTALKSVGYLTLPEKGWDAYLNELNSWNTFISSISTSAVYKDWINTKQHKYYIPKRDTLITAENNYQYNDPNNFLDPSTITNPDPNNKGINYDASGAKSIMKAATGPKPNNPDKISNLECQFAFRLQDLYSPNVVNL